MATKKRVLVTGASGFIGRHLTKALKNNNYIVHTLDKNHGNDICRKTSFSPLFNKKIEVVFHLAGKTYVPDSWSREDIFYEVNTFGTQRVLEFCRQTKARLIYLSAYVYGTPRYLPIDENHPVKPDNPYAISKWLAEEICRLYAEVMGVKVTILRPFNVFGPGQRDCFLIPTLLKQVKKKGKIIVKDDTPKRDYLYIDDLIAACLLAVKQYEKLKIFNVGYGSAFSVREIIEIICQYHEKDIPWKSLRQIRKNEIPETIANCELIKKSLGWGPKIDFREGIRRTMFFS